MNDLEQHLARLTAHLREQHVAASWSHVKIIEGPVDHGPEIVIIPRRSLQTPGEYAPRFDALLNQGHGWINLSAVGVLEDTLLVSIELPGYRNYVARGDVSVNLSGPAMVDGVSK